MHLSSNIYLIMKYNLTFDLFFGTISGQSIPTIRTRKEKMKTFILLTFYVLFILSGATMCQKIDNGVAPIRWIGMGAGFIQSSISKDGASVEPFIQALAADTKESLAEMFLNKGSCK